MARTLGYLHVAGGTLALASLALPTRSGANVPALLVMIALAILAGVALVLFATRMPGFLVPLILAFATTQVALAVHFDGRGSSVFGLYFVWIGMLAFYFLEWPKALVQIGLMGAAFAVVMTTVEETVPAQRWLMTVGTALAGGLVVAYMRSSISALVAQLTDAARTDPLTGLLNRRALEELFNVELDRAQRGNRPMSVIVGDLDGFKAVNDRLGHQAGDLALCKLAEELGRWKRRIDMAARVGGEEFALLLPETDERGAFLVAERLRRATQRTFADEPVPITISFGIATYPDHGSDAELLLRAADQALYAAKDLGRDRTVIYSEEVARALSGGHRADHELRVATLVALAESLDIRDTGSSEHCHTVARYAAMAAAELGFDPDHVERVRLAGVLHDIGKAGVSNNLLSKPGPLDDEEWREMHTHPEIAARLLEGPELADLATWIGSHHERVDGTGYPDGLSGDEIPLESRILAVADAFEAMTADRVYSPALGDDAARDELLSASDAQFDGEVVRAFLRALDRRGPLAPTRSAAAVTK
jgi:diguanylate cyclase (GGDEF)-like protein/putative nucleotidyltransferase with HDIG domain